MGRLKHSSSWLERKDRKIRLAVVFSLDTGFSRENGMNDFDQAGRFQVKSNAEAHVAWLFPRAATVMRFARWLDSQSAPRPGEPDRRCDTIAELVHRAGQDAVAFLDAIDQNRLSPALLPWAVLMQRGQTKETAVRWVGLSSRLDETERRDAASLALTFSELTDSRPLWKPVLETIPMNESITFREQRNEGRTEGRKLGRLEMQRDNLTRVLRTKLSGDQLTAARERVEKQDDLELLSRWFDLALTLSPDALLAEFAR